MGTTALLSGDRWVGTACERWEVAAPSRADLSLALGRLDAARHTSIEIERPGGERLSIGGGDGRYFVMAELRPDSWKVLTRPEAADGVVLLNVGGQAGDYPASRIVDLASARRAAHVFLETGALDPGQAWIDD